MNEGLSWEAIGVISSITVGVLVIAGGAVGSLIGVLWRLSTRLEKMAVAVETLAREVTEDRQEHYGFAGRIHGHDITLADHERRLMDLESEDDIDDDPSEEAGQCDCGYIIE